MLASVESSLLCPFAAAAAMRAARRVTFLCAALWLLLCSGWSERVSAQGSSSSTAAAAAAGAFNSSSGASGSISGNNSSSSGSFSSTAAGSWINPALILTVTLSLNLNPLVSLPVNFSSDLTSDLVLGLGVTADRLALGHLGGATSQSGSVAVGTSVTFSVLPSSNTSLITPPQVLASIQQQFYAGVGPLFNGTQTSKLNRAYLLVLSTGSIATSSSSTGTSAASRAQHEPALVIAAAVIVAAWLMQVVVQRR